MYNMKEKILIILRNVSDGKKSPEEALIDILFLINQIEEFDVDSTQLEIGDQARLSMLMSTGKIIIKPVIK